MNIDNLKSGVHFIYGEAPSSAGEEIEIYGGELDGNKVSSLREFCDKILAISNFPGEWNGNYDAFTDIIGDLWWLKTDIPMLIIVRNARSLLKNSDEFDKDIFCSIVSGIDDFWRSEIRHAYTKFVGFYLVFECDEGSRPVWFDRQALS